MRSLLLYIVILLLQISNVHAGAPILHLSTLLQKLANDYPDFTPNAIVDVGANKGRWGREARRIFPSAKLLMLEASPQHEQVLKATVAELGHAEYQIAVLTAQAGETISFFQTGDTGNSMFQEQTKHYLGKTPVQRITSTLDDQVAASFLKTEAIDILKVDVQGAELLVLQGGSALLAQATFVQLEASIVEFNAGGVCFYELETFLRRHGYFLYDLGDMLYSAPGFKTRGAGQFDVTFVRPTSPRLPEFLQVATFCGQHRQSTSTTTTTWENTLAVMMPIDDRSTDGPQGLSWITWGCGFLAGLGASALFSRVTGRRTKTRASIR